MHRYRIGYAAAVGLLLSCPVAAADRLAILDYGSDRLAPSSFVGASISLTRTAEGDARSSLRFGASRHHRTYSAGITQLPAAVEIRFAGADSEGVYVGGHRLAAAEGGKGPKAGQILLIVAGIAASALLVTQIAGSDDEDDDGERCLVEPWLCD